MFKVEPIRGKCAMSGFLRKACVTRNTQAENISFVGNIFFSTIFFLTSLCLCKISVPARACSELGRPVFGWVPCLVLLTQCQFPPQRTGLLWRSPTALIQFYSPSTPAHEWCKPIRPMLFIRPLRAIIFPNLERNQPFSFLFSSLYLSSSSFPTLLSLSSSNSSTH